eukprot:EG_transcript_571
MIPQRTRSDSRSRIGSGALPAQKASKENLHPPGTTIAASPRRRVINLDIDAPPLQAVENRDFDLLDRNDSKSQALPKRSSSQTLKPTSFLKADASDQAQMDWDWIKKSLAERTITLDRERGAVQPQGSDLQRSSTHSVSDSANHTESSSGADHDALRRINPGPYKREEQLELDMEALKARIQCLEQESALGSSSSISRQSTEIARLALELTAAKERTLQDTVTMQQLSVELVQLQAEVVTKADALRYADQQAQELQQAFCDFEAQLSAKDAEIAALKQRLQEESQRVECSSQEMLDFREALAEMEDRCNQKNAELAQARRALDDERQRAGEEQCQLLEQLQALQVQNVEAQSRLQLLQAQNHQQQDQREAEEMRELRRTLLDIERQALHKDGEVMKLKAQLQDERCRAAEAERQQQQAVRQLEAQLQERQAEVLKVEAAQQDLRYRLLDDAEVQRLQHAVRELERQGLQKDIEIAKLRAITEDSREERTMLHLPRETFSEMERQASVKETEISKLRDMLEEERLQALRDLQQMQESLQQVERQLADRENELAALKGAAAASPGEADTTTLADLCHADPAVGHVIASMEAMLHQKDGEIEGLSRDMEELAQEFLNLERKIRDMEAALLDKEEQLELLRSTARQAAPSFDAERIPQLELQLSQQERTIAQLQQQLQLNAAPQESLQFYREVDERQREEIRWQREELGRCREELARERGERERQVQEVARQTKELEQLRARAAHLTEALSQKDTDTQQQTTGRASLEGELQQLRDELQAAQAALEEKEAALHHQAAATAALEAAAAELTATLQERDAALADQAEELRRLRAALDHETEQRMASEERGRDLRRETTQFQEATRVFKDYELPAEPDDDALAVAEAEAAGRAELLEEEAAQWRDVRSWEDECWHDVVREQRQQWAEEEEAMQQRLQDLEDLLFAREAEADATTETASSQHRRSSVPAFDDLPDPFSYPMVSDTQGTQSDTASTAAWLASSSNLTAVQSSSRSNPGGFGAGPGLASAEKVRADLLPQFNQQSTSKAPPAQRREADSRHPPPPSDASGWPSGQAVPTKYIPRDYVLPLDFGHPRLTHPPPPAAAAAAAAPPSPRSRPVERACPLLPPAIFLSEATAQAPPSTSGSVPSEFDYPTPPSDGRYLHGTQRSTRSTATTSSSAHGRASSVNPSPRGTPNEWPPRHRSLSAARDQTPGGDVVPRSGLFESLSGLKMRTHDSNLRRAVDKERERLEKIAEKQRKEELHAEKERLRQERKEREKAARKKEGKRGLLLGLWP